MFINKIYQFNPPKPSMFSIHIRLRNQNQQKTQLIIGTQFYLIQHYLKRYIQILIIDQNKETKNEKSRDKPMNQTSPFSFHFCLREKNMTINSRVKFSKLKLLHHSRWLLLHIEKTSPSSRNKPNKYSSLLFLVTHFLESKNPPTKKKKIISN